MSAAVKSYSIDPSLPYLFESGTTRGPVAIPSMPGELLERSNWRGAWAATRVILPVFLLTTAAPWLVLHVGIWTLAILIPMLGTYVYKATIVLHDCAHYTLFQSRGLNRWVGRFAAALVGVRFEHFRNSHLQHHQYNGQKDDAEGGVYPAMVDASRGRLVWHCLEPLTGLTFVKTYLSGAFAVSPAKPTDRPSSSTLPLILTILLQIVLAVLATGFGTVWWLLPLYPATAATFGLFFSRLRGFCEHLPPASWDKGPFVRSHASKFFDLLLFYDLGMNYHVEHHLFPNIPGYRLRHVCRRLESIHTPQTLSPSICHTLWRALAR